MTSARLITIRVSHYCEKARWALDHAGVAYTEDAHAPLFHMPAVRRHSKKTSTPVLLIDGRTVPDSTDILEYLDARLEPSRALYPRDGRRAEVVALEEDFDVRLGPHVRRFAYYHLLPHTKVAIEVLGAGVPATQRALLPLLFPLLLRPGIRRGLGIDAPRAQRSREKVQAVFDDVSARLADGRPYLVGEQFSAADLTFAALAAPALSIGAYASLPDAATLSPELAEVQAILRASPAGKFAERMHTLHRSRS